MTANEPVRTAAAAAAAPPCSLPHSLTHSSTVSLTCAKFNSWGPFRRDDRGQLGAGDGVRCGGNAGEVAEGLRGGATRRGLDFLAHTWSLTQTSLLPAPYTAHDCLTAHPKESTFQLRRASEQSSLSYIFLQSTLPRHSARAAPRLRPPQPAMQRCRCRTVPCRCRNCRTRTPGLKQRPPEPANLPQFPLGQRGEKRPAAPTP